MTDNQLDLTVIIVDDEKNILHIMAHFAKQMGCNVLTADNATQAMDLIKQTKIVDVAFLDYNMPDKNGLDLLKEIKTFNSKIDIVMLTAFSAIPLVVQAVREGAFEFLTKPFRKEEIETVLRKIHQKRKQSLEEKRDREEFKVSYTFGDLIGNSIEMRDVYKQVSKISATTSPVFIVGETGTGKELLAKEIHNRSKIADKPFVAVNCAALSHSLLESEFFGHTLGAFTDAKYDKAGIFRTANGGTVFLDEITETPLEFQAKLLRVIEYGEVKPVGSDKTFNVSVRILASSNRNPRTMVSEGKIREDLFYRVSVFMVELPPLRSRTGDITILVEHFLKKLNEKHNTDKRISPDALQMLSNYEWPGNVRELNRAIERAYFMCEGGVIELSDIQLVSIREKEVGAASPGGIASIEDVELQAILKALKYTKGDKPKASEMLGIGIATLYRKIKKYGLDM